MLRTICSKTRSYHLFLLGALEISIFQKWIDGRRKDEKMLRTICSKTRSYHLFLLGALEISIFRKRIDGKRKFERISKFLFFENE